MIAVATETTNAIHVEVDTVTKELNTLDIMAAWEDPDDCDIWIACAMNEDIFEAITKTITLAAAIDAELTASTICDHLIRMTYRTKYAPMPTAPIIENI